MEFNARLKDARVSKGLTQEKLADMVGVGTRNYQMYEHGTRRPKYETLVELADILGVTTDWLLCRTDEK